MSRSQVPDSELLNTGYRYALSLVANSADAQDLVQAAWLRLLKKNGQSPEKPLLFRTIRNLHIDAVRHNKVRTRYAEINLPEIDDSYNDIDSTLLNSEELSQHLARLRDRERETLFLAVIEGYTADEIAYMTGQSRGTVLSMLHRTKRKLRDWIQNRDLSPARVIPFPNSKERT